MFKSKDRGSIGIGPGGSISGTHGKMGHHASGQLRQLAAIKHLARGLVCINGDCDHRHRQHMTMSPTAPAKGCLPSPAT